MADVLTVIRSWRRSTGVPVTWSQTVDGSSIGSKRPTDERRRSASE